MNFCQGRSPKSQCTEHVGRSQRLPYAYLNDLFTKLANRHLARDIDALMPWAYRKDAKGS